VSALPPSLLAATKASALVERTRSERLASLLDELGQLFERGGARVLFVKDPLFARRFHGDLDARGLADLDVPSPAPADVDRVAALPLGAGFARAFRALGSRRPTRWFGREATRGLFGHSRR